VGVFFFFCFCCYAGFTVNFAMGFAIGAGS
jgi:hypothetical protein